ncbi:tRNA (N6-isopentenyl adenosine(37)-C2)-methylthiotransferase MiaB [Ruminiclostridium cellulolyticum]|uniref:tRNA-2-methylthio-N(6)-dimethylallyladenosine synthase n=1 Tax=Ruminiclostridium cellulolyticum (strain ATCC 35319 / DSM 5812 / JCM 6584 / H10) TaxID=394503 RepID=B8I2Q7_RUMCH|nr:tRNA (N6-isopentenyl adenosine(37)-C2)-methylthiotransferase MiaB [Ruminiclostridium cellulolyticum]ACL76050.1 RNA modification enzyme, MiaB family [Ruminiclostridium cellulolyticum H10]
MSEGKRITTKVSAEEINQQYKYIETIKQYNQGVISSIGKPVRYIIETFGCQMNENDSERLSGMLSGMGYSECSERKDSDLIIFNTCCVRENAEQKVYGHLGALKKLKETNPNLIIAICGCMMQQKDVVEHIKKTYKHVDIVFGTHNLYKFPELLNTAITTRSTVIDVWDSTGSIAENMPISRKENIKAWVTVMYGCNNFCSYCIVPYVRGRERSRSLEEIKNEVEKLAKDGCKEITLLGQNVNSYGKDLEGDLTFAGLLRELNKVQGIERIRFMTSHPKDLSDELIYAMRDCEKVCEHLHLPVQAGSSKILDEMNRRYSKEQYLGLIEKVKSNIPGIALTTDIIVGFPGETEEDFNETLDVVAKARFDMAYTFLYSKRTGTPAAKNPEQIPETVKKQRFDRLLELQNKISKEINDGLLGKELEVLVEGLSKSSKTTYTGRTRENKIVNFKGSPDMVGKLVKVKIEEIQTWSLLGKINK